MKTLVGLSIAVAMFFSTPGTAQQNLNNNGDNGGVYNQGQPAAPAPQGMNNNMQSADQMNQHMGPADSNSYSNTDNYYSDDYDDYGYSARLRRYDDNWGDWGYYDDVYTNSYWYSGDPYQFGMSIYMGSPWWGPSAYWYSFCPSYYCGYGYDFGFGCGYPYYGLGFGWGRGCGWGGGYGWGGGNRWGRGYNNYYYNSFDGNSNFGGPRGGYNGGRGVTGPAISPGSNGTAAVGPGKIGGRGTGVSPASSFGEMYQNSIKSEAAKNPGSYVKSSNGSLHMAPSVSSARLATARVSSNSTRPAASYRSSGMTTKNGNMNNRSVMSRNNTGSMSRNGYSSASRSSYSRPSYGRGSSGYSSTRYAPSQGSRSSGNYNYRTSNSGSRSYGGGSHTFGGGVSHSSGGGHSFGGGGGHSSGGGFGGGGSHSSGGGGGGHGGGGRR